MSTTYEAFLAYGSKLPTLAPFGSIDDLMDALPKRFAYVSSWHYKGPTHIVCPVGLVWETDGTLAVNEYAEFEIYAGTADAIKEALMAIGVVGGEPAWHLGVQTY